MVKNSEYNILISNFTSIGYTDGYRALLSDHDNLIDYLIAMNIEREIMNYIVKDYLVGYETGFWTRESEMYDSDYSIDSLVDDEDAIKAIEKRLYLKGEFL